MTKEEADSAPPSEVQDLTKEKNAVARPITPLSQSLGTAATLADWTRLALAGGLLAILGVLTLGTGWFVANYPDKEKAIEAFLQLVFTPLIGLVGSVVGFYFGTRSSGSAASRRRS
jgi:hypothetical protein